MPSLDSLRARCRRALQEVDGLAPARAPNANRRAPEPVSDDIKAEIAELKRRIAVLERGPVRYR